MPQNVIRRNIEKGNIQVPLNTDIEKPDSIPENVWNKLPQSKKDSIIKVLREQRQKQAITSFKPANTIKEAEEFAKNYAKKADYSNIDLAKANEVNRTLQKISTGKKVDKISFAKGNVKIRGNENDVFVQGVYRYKTNEIELRSDLQITPSKRALQRSTKKYWSDKLDNLKRELKDDPNNSYLKDQIRNLEFRVEHFSRENVGWSLSDILTHEYGHKIDYQNKLSLISQNEVLTASDKLFIKSNLGKIPENVTQKQYFTELVSEYAATNTHELFAESYLMKSKGEKLPKWMDDLITNIVNNAE